MKTSIQTLFAAALSLVMFTGSAFASTTETTNTVTVLSQIKNINKLVVNGNVEVILIQAPTESVKVYDSYYSKNALVQQEDGVLRISSFQKEKLTVAVYVRNLSTIEAAGTSTVTTSGKVNFLSLAIALKDSSSADINSSTVNIMTTVTDNASLKLTGTTTEHYAVLSSLAKMTMDQFVSDNTSVKTLAPVYAKAVAKQTLDAIVYDAR